MKCFKGIHTSFGTVPCGQCINCRINQGRKWTARILCEWIGHYHYTGQQTYFVTLTYDDSKVPRTPEGVPTLRKRKAIDWVRNTASLLGGFRYYLIGEYGDDTFRPHLHMALFPRQDSQVPAVLERWPSLVKSASELSPQRAGYLARYTAKKLTKDTDERLEKSMEPEFRTSSRRPPVGASYLPILIRSYDHPAHASEIKKRGDVFRAVRISGKIYPLDGYMLRQLRLHFDIPQTHTGRIDANPNYLDYYQTEEAERDFSKADFYEVKHEFKEKTKKIARANI